LQFVRELEKALLMTIITGKMSAHKLINANAGEEDTRTKEGVQVHSFLQV
jgi:hypothetical protein